MNFAEYVRKVNKMLKDRPETAKMKAIFAVDEEGNAFKELYYDVSLGFFDGNDFDAENVEEQQPPPNAVCIN